MSLLVRYIIRSLVHRVGNNRQWILLLWTHGAVTRTTEGFQRQKHFQDLGLNSVCYSWSVISWSSKSTFRCILTPPMSSFINVPLALFYHTQTAGSWESQSWIRCVYCSWKNMTKVAWNKNHHNVFLSWRVLGSWCMTPFKNPLLYFINDYCKLCNGILSVCLQIM